MEPPAKKSSPGLVSVDRRRKGVIRVSEAVQREQNLVHVVGTDNVANSSLEIDPCVGDHDNDQASYASERGELETMLAQRQRQVLPMHSVLLLIAFLGSGQVVEAPDQPAPIPDVLFIPTPIDIVDRMLELAKVGKDDVVYDLGCGDGRILVRAVQKYGRRAVGFDIDPRRVKQTQENLRKHKVEDLAGVEEKDLFLVDLRPASVITLYLSPKYNARLIPELEKMKAGSRIVSHLFEMDGATPDKKIECWSEFDRRIHTLYLWTVPLRKGRPP